MHGFLPTAGALERHAPGEVLRIEPWGPHAVRVRAAATAIDPDLPGALDPAPPAADAGLTVHDDGSAHLVNGRLTVAADAGGNLRFLHTGDGRELLAEQPPAREWLPGSRRHRPLGDGSYHLEQRFAAYPDERLFGLGQHPNGRLDQKGLVIDLVQSNTEATVPFLHSSRGYGLLWHNPAYGRVELAGDTTRWVTDSAQQIDYWITAGDTPAEIAASYAGVTGHPPLLPEWATGFWQSKLRYRTQEELLAVAREYARRKLPLSVIVCDFFHWPRMGDWRAGVRARPVYLPAGARWLDPVTAAVHDGGALIEAAAPLERIPLCVREGAAVSAALAPHDPDIP